MIAKTQKIGYKCPQCGVYSDKSTKVVKLGKGWMRFEYGCGHRETCRPEKIGTITRG